MKISSKRTIVLIIFVVGLSLSACDRTGNGLSGGTEAKVNDVEVVAVPGNPPRYSVLVSGIFPDGCTQAGHNTQRVVANSIRITLYTNQTTEGQCSRIAPIPFTEAIRIRVSGLKAGSYSVDVNGAVTTFFLTEDH